MGNKPLVKKIMRVAALFTLFVSITASAAFWVKVGDSVDGDQYFFDQNSVTRNGSEMSFTLVIDYKNPPTKDQKKFLSDKSEMVVDCLTGKNKTLKLTYFSEFNLEGAVVWSSETPNAKWESSLPNTAASAIQGRICSMRLTMPPTKNI
jgi:hypothetical protein